jgi:Arylsulfotransferase (ASST)
VLTRGQFLRAAGGGLAGFVVSGRADAALWRASGLGGTPAASTARSQSWLSFRSRPDLRPPALFLSDPSAAAATAAEGYLFVCPTSKPLAQAGALIVDTAGHPVWFHPVRPGRWASNFRVQSYAGRPVLTWWQGEVRPPGYGRGEGVILDSSYEQLAVVRAAHGRAADLHEFRLTPQGTALITCFPQTAQADLSAVGGPRDGLVYESIIQEIDVRTGRLLLEWRGLDHIPVGESYQPIGGTYDYLHVNSIDVMPDGHLLVSGRATCALYKVHRHSGRVLWRLGGERSDFAMGRDTRFNWQHDAQWAGPGRISVFDNGSGPERTEPHSRGLLLDVDQARRTVRLAHAYRHPTPLRTLAMGSVQPLADGNVMVCWGLIPTLSEFSPQGELLTELLLPWGYNSYRGFRMPWEGLPTDRPALATGPPTSSGTSVLYASWNGATGVANWQVSVGQSAASMQPAGSVPRRGFETAIPVSTSQGYAAVTALDAGGAALASSAPLAL